MTDYLLSAIIPFLYRSEDLDHLMNLVKIVLSKENIQLIVVIDESEERLPVKNFKNHLPIAKNLEVVSGNFGSPGLSRNAGLLLATGKWIVFWDSDDEVCVDQFLNMIDSAERLKKDICIGEFETFTSGSNSDRHRFHIPKSQKYLQPSIAKRPGIWRFAFRNNGLIITKEFCDNLLGEDQLFLIENDIFKFDIYLHRSVVYKYRINQVNQITNSFKSIKDLNRVLKTLNNDIEKLSSSGYIYISHSVLRILVTILKNAERYSEVIDSIKCAFCIILRILNISLTKKSRKYQNEN